MNICGIDPGLKGGLAMSEGNKMYGYPMPISGKDIDVMAIVDLLHSHHINLVICEQVHAMPARGKNGEKSQGITSTFTFGKGYGMVLGAVMGAGIPLELVSPQKWKSVTLCNTEKDKKAAVDFCRRRYPDVNLVMPRCRTPHDGIADAVCILHYGLNLYNKKEVA